MKSFKQFSEQAVAAAAPAPTPKFSAKAQPKPKVSDPSSGVDIDDKGRWEGDVVNTGQELEPGYEKEVKPGKSGPDPDMPAGEAKDKTDPLALSQAEKDLLKELAEVRGAEFAINVERNLKIEKLKELEKSGEITPAQQAELIALQGLQAYTQVGTAAKIASDILDVITSVGSLTSLSKLGINTFINASPTLKAVIGGTVAIGAEVLTPPAAVTSVKVKDLTKVLSKELPGYTLSDPSFNKGDHVSYLILDPNGKPIPNPENNNKPFTIGGRRESKTYVSDSAKKDLMKAIKKIKIPKVPLKLSHELEGTMLSENNSRIIGKSFNQFSEQTRNTSMPRVVSAKVQPKPKVSDPSTGVDIDDKGRWEGQIVGKGKEIKPKEVVKVKDGVKGPDPNLPAGSANPNAQIAGLSAQERKELMMLRKGLIKGDFGTGPDIDKQIRNLDIKLFGIPVVKKV